MSQYFFHNFSGRTGPNYCIKSFDTMHVLNGVILRVGLGLSMPSELSAVQVIDLHGVTILPAFSDAHVHFLQTGICMLGCQLQDATSLSNIYDALLVNIKTNEDWLFGWNMDEILLHEKRLPTRLELDKVVINKKVWLARKDLHSAVLNTKALEWAKTIIPNLNVNNDIISGDDYNHLSYELIKYVSKHSKHNALELARDECFKQGVAHVHALEGSQDTISDVKLTADFFSKSLLDGTIYHQSKDPNFALEHKWSQLGGCLLADGSFGSRTASLHKEYSDNASKGQQYLQPSEIESLLTTCNKHKLQLAIHAIGDRAIDTVSSCYLWASEKFANPLIKNRIEHFLLPSEHALLNVKKSFTMIGIQPAFDHYWGGPENLYEQRLGKARARKCNPFKTMLDIGIQMGGGSDSPVTPINPILGIHALLNHSNQDEQLDINAAISLFVSEPHKLTGKDNNLGQLKSGFMANFICFKEDPTISPRHKFKNNSVDSLFIRGQRVK